MKGFHVACRHKLFYRDANQGKFLISNPVRALRLLLTPGFAYVVDNYF